LSFDEFNKGMTEYGAKLSADEAKELFLSFDKDGTGSIDFDELLIAVRVTCFF
jgi:Ca2+-binding EF-hand superfamily protein